MEFQFTDRDNTKLELNDIKFFRKDRLDGVLVGETKYTIKERIKIEMTNGETRYLEYTASSIVNMEIDRLQKFMGTRL